jgi:serine/threonine-protein phosphatase 6 regulatory ankyrin repeat subunit B
MRKPHARSLRLIAALSIGLAVGAPAFADEIVGAVSEVDEDGTFITISLPSGPLPRVGDLVVITQDVPGLGAVAVDGEWEITGVNETSARAAANGDAVKPQVGQTAAITSVQPRTRAQVALDVQLHAAADSGDPDAVRAALQGGAELDGRGVMGATALIRAAMHGNLEAMQALVEAGANLEVESRLGRTPLMTAANGGHAGAIRLLVDAGADLETRASSPHTPGDLVGGTALLLAARNGHGAATRALLRAGANVEARSTAGNTALFLAATDSDYGETVRELLAAGADPNAVRSDGAGPLLVAASARGGTLVPLLLRAGARTELRVSADVPEPFPGMTPLLIAAYIGDEVAVTYLLGGGADAGAVTTAGRSATELAAEDGHTAVLEALANPGGAAAEAQRLLAKEMESALRRGNSAEVATLLAAGADPNRVDEEGATPLIQALGAREDEADILAMTRALLGAGARINDVGSAGVTALMTAVAFTGPGPVNLLLQQGASIDVQSTGASDNGEGVEPGMTALMVAAGWGHEEIAVLLLGAGADPTIVDEAGKTAAAYAIEEGYDSLARLLSPER